MCCIHGKNLICGMAAVCNLGITLNSLIYTLLLRACSMLGPVLSTEMLHSGDHANGGRRRKSNKDIQNVSDDEC